MYLEVVIRLLVAAVLGSLIGLERQRLDRGSGLRTHALVATASALIISSSSPPTVSPTCFRRGVSSSTHRVSLRKW